MRLHKLVKFSFILSLIFSVLGAYLKITHKTGAETCLMIGLMATLIFIVSAIAEVFSSKRIAHNEKIMWTIGFIFLSAFTGLVYFFIGRKRIAETA